MIEGKLQQLAPDEETLEFRAIEVTTSNVGYDQACRHTDTGAREPGAHFIVTTIASAINMVAGKDAQALYWRQRTIARRPDASIAQFFAAIPL